MRQGSSSSQAFADRLREMDDERLAALLRVRAVRDTGIKDFFDLADRLLERNSVHAALSSLDRPTLVALALAGDAPLSAEHSTLLYGKGLVAGDEPGALPYDAVAETLDWWPTIGLPSREQLTDPAPPALGPVSMLDPSVTDHAAAERAFATTFAVLEIVVELDRSPARQLVRGGVALPDAKRLASTAAVALDDLVPLLALCEDAGLIALDGGSWLPTESASSWQGLGSVQRWVQLAAGWFASLPGDIRSLLADRPHFVWDAHLIDYVRWLYPGDTDTMEARLLAQVRGAELLGVTADRVPSTPGTAILRGDARGAAAAMARLFPQEVHKAYLQHDLTVVSPGPLEAALDARLRHLADVESRGLATTYRITAGSINRAISEGYTEGSITEFLASISLTGIPQPLSYLIEETARRHGLVRVGRADLDGSYVRSVDPNLLSAIAVDQRLGALGLTRDSLGLVSGFDTQLVFWALSDARYPVAAENAHGAIITLDRKHSVSRPIDAADPALAIIERLRAAKVSTAESGAAWLERQLDSAIKERVAVFVAVKMPDGNTVDYILEPTGLGGGRVRARDRKADIERTLPLASIIEVRAVE